MNLLRAIFGNRRKADVNACGPDRRKSGPMSRSKAASDRLDKATDDLCHTVSMSREDFKRMMDAEK